MLSVAQNWTDLTVLAPDLSVGEAVVAAELAKAGRLDATAMSEVMALRAEGASWGLIAVSQGIRAIPAEIPGVDAVVVPVVNNVATQVLDPNTVILIPQPNKIPVKAVTPLTTPPDDVVTPPTEPVRDSEPVVADPLAPLIKGLSGVLSGLLG